MRRFVLRLLTSATVVAFTLSLVPLDVLAAPPDVSAAPPDAAPELRTAPSLADSPAFDPPTPDAPAPAPTLAPNDRTTAGWQLMLGEQVDVQRVDGIFVYGQLQSVDDTSVVILGSDGIARQVAREEVHSVAMLNGGEAPKPGPEVKSSEIGKRPILNRAEYEQGKAVMTAGVFLLGIGFITGLVGAGVALGESDALYLAFVSVPGAVVSFAIGLPLLSKGINMRKSALGSVVRRGPTLLVHDRRGKPRLVLGPGGGPSPFGGGIALRF
ncbi:hypothetical protein ENSA5_06370 [Enhygromyxa salina]|uniref:Uncharacterized protein n=2 Tax=Enhygromyxa salina TaxID=215803 RepID=A0A2S9YHW6_9BACT|nr:hypothetical protein ENSA5_06370 [Enhygromyxa salina]